MKTARFCRAVFIFAEILVLFAATETARPPAGTAGLRLLARRGRGLRRCGRWWFGRGLGGRRCCRFRLGIDQETHLFAYGRTPPRGALGLLSGLALAGGSNRIRLTGLDCLELWLLLRRPCDGFGLNLRQRGWLGRIAVEIGHRAGCFRRRDRSEFVCNRSGKPILGAAATATSAATPAAARPPLAAGRLVGASLAIRGAVF